MRFFAQHNVVHSFSEEFSSPHSIFPVHFFSEVRLSLQKGEGSKDNALAPNKRQGI